MGAVQGGHDAAHGAEYGVLVPFYNAAGLCMERDFPVEFRDAARVWFLRPVGGPRCFRRARLSLPWENILSPVATFLVIVQVTLSETFHVSLQAAIRVSQHLACCCRDGAEAAHLIGAALLDAVEGRHEWN